MTGLNKLFKFKRLNASPEFNKFDNIWHCWELHTIGKSIVAINKKMIDNLKNPVFGDLVSNPDKFIINKFINHAVHQLWCLLYLCNPILSTINISNYKFCNIIILHHQVTKIKEIKNHRFCGKDLMSSANDWLRFVA